MTQRSLALGHDEPSGAGRGREGRNGRRAAGHAPGVMTSVLEKTLVQSEPPLKANHYASQACQTHSEYHLCAPLAQLVSGKTHSEVRGSRAPIRKLCGVLMCVRCGSCSSGPPQQPQDTGTIRAITRWLAQHPRSNIVQVKAG